MASNRDKKTTRAVERERYRGTYKLLKELRIWLCLALAICIGTTVYAGMGEKDDSRYNNDIIANGSLRDSAAAYADEAYKTANGISDENARISVMAMSYYFYRDYYLLINDDSFYTDGYGTYGLDPEKPLKSQMYTELRSWFDELMNSASAAAVQTLQYSMLADVNGAVLDAEALAAIEAEVEALKNAAKGEGMTLNEHLSYRYCPGMTESDLRYFLERYYLAEQYYYDSAEAVTSCTEEEIAEYYSEHKDELTNAFIYRYEIKYDDDTEAEALKRAEAFVECEDAESFYEMIKAAAIADYGLADEDLESFLDECRITVLPDDYTGDFADWLFASARRDGDTYMDKNDGYIGVYYIDRAAGKYKFSSVSIRSIYISAEYAGSVEAAKETAKEVYSLAVADGTEGYFTELVSQYTHDTNTVSYGGAYVDIVPGDITREYEKWIFEDGREVGDIGIIEVDGDYFVAYVTGFGDACWKVAAERELVDEKMEAFEAEAEDAAKISTDSKAIYDDVPDELATDTDRGYKVKEKDGVLTVSSDSVSIAFVCLFAADIVLLGGTVFCFVYAHKLKKRYFGGR